MNRVRAIQRPSWRLAALAVLFSAAFIALGWSYYASQKSAVHRAAMATLASIADLKASQIAGWYRERLVDAEMFTDPQVISDEIAEFRAQPADAERRAELQQWMQRLQLRYDYTSVHLSDEKGGRLLSVPDDPSPPSAHALAHIASAIRQKKVVASDLHLGAKSGQIHLTLSVPVGGHSRTDPRIIGVFQFLIDPSRFLFPLVRTWPTPSRTAETLLVRREGGELIYLSDRRDRPGAALRTRVPPGKSADILSALAAPAAESVVLSTDHRDQPILLAVRAIPGTPWLMVAKVDLAEVDAPLTKLAWTTAMIVAILIAAAFLGVGLLWRQRTIHAVHEREALFRALFDDAPVGYHEIDAQGRIVRVNRTELALLGYAEGDLIGRELAGFTADPAEAAAEIAALQAGRLPASLVVERQFRRQDGTFLPVLISSRQLRTASGAVAGLRSSMQDLTERKRAETALRESQEKYRTLFAHAGDAIIIHDGTGQVLAVNARACEQYGYTEAEMLAITVQQIDTPEEAVHAPARIAHLMAHGVHQFETVHRRKDDTPVPVEVIARRITWGGQPAMMSLCRDITERRRIDTILRRSEARYRALFSQSGDHILVLEIEPGRVPVIAEVNDAAVKAHGYTREEMIGQPISLIDPDVDPAREAHHPRVRSDHSETVFEVQHRRKDGTLFDVEVRAKPVEIDGRTVVLSVERDITERKRTEQALRELKVRIGSQELYSVLVEMASDGFWLLDREFTTVYVNPAVEAMLGYAKEEMIGRSWYSFGDPEWVARARELEARRASGVREPHHFLFVRKDGRKVMTRIATTPLYDRNGNFDGALGILSDISRQQEAQEALKAKEALDTIGKSAGFGICLINQDYTIAWHNELYGKWSGARAAAIGRSCYEVFAGGHTRCAECPARATFSGGEVSFAEHQNTTPGMGDRCIALTTAAIRNAEGQVIQVLEIAHDITERKRAESEREKLQGQLTQAQKMESIGRLAGGVAHDFNNMLTAILGNTSLALLGLPLTSPLRDNLSEIQKCAQRSAELTRQLLAFARKQTIAPRVLDLNATVEGMSKMLRRLIGEDIELAWRPAADLWHVKIDPSQIDQVLANLCVNARDAIAGVGRITLETGHAVIDEAASAARVGVIPGEYVLLVVSDTGCGMSQEVLNHLFEPFFTTKAAGQGTGLGLATVFGIVRQNQGFIDVDSATGRGTSFKICLPRYVGGQLSVSEDTSAPLFQRGTETILLVEDEPAILRVAHLALESLGYRVLAANTPNQAISLAEEHSGKIDLLMTDVVMPEMNGRDLAALLGARHPRLKHLFTSGYTANIIGPHGLLEEGIHFLQKPFSTGELAAKIRAILDE